MNERIIELKQQAEDYVDSVDDGLGIERYRQSVDLKFAELIVRECMKVSRSADGLDATHEAWYLIQEHFGLGLSTEDKKTLIKELLGVKNEGTF